MKHDTHTNEYIGKLKSIKLDPSIRVRMWIDLEKYAEFHSVTDQSAVGEGKRYLRAGTMEPVSVLANLNFLNLVQVSFIVALVAFGGGTSLVAHGSLPGDLLYPIKVHVNERVESALTFGTDSETKLQVTVLEERLREATELAVRGDLTGDIARKVENTIDEQTEKVLAISKKSSVVTQAEVRNQLDSVLENFGVTLADLGSEVGTKVATRIENKMGETLAQADIDTRRGASLETDEYTPDNAVSNVDLEISTMAMQTDDTVTLSMPVGKLMDIETLIADLEVRIEALKTVFKAIIGIDVESKNEIEKDIERAQKSLSEAKVKFKNNDELGARTDLDLGFVYLGNAEATLSLIGDLIVDPETGMITGINIGGLVGSGQGQIESDGAISIEVDAEDSPLQINPILQINEATTETEETLEIDF